MIETKAPEGFEINTEEIKVIVPNSDTVINNTSVTITNEEQYFIRIIKKDDLTSNTLAGAEFDVYDESNTLVGKIKDIGEDGIGQLKVPSLGKYYLVETKAPEGYDILKERIEVTSSTNPLLNTTSIYNSKSNLIITVIKKDEDNPNKYLIGAEFDVFDENDTKIAHIITDENGTATFKVKEAGTYYLIETKAPENYECRTDKIEITIDNSGESITNASITITNTSSKKYYIRVTKNDANTNIPLGNAVFEIYKEDKITKLEKNLITTLPFGSEKIEVPCPGVYYLKEIVAPIGYELIPDLIEVVVDDNDDIVTKEIIKDVTISNNKSIEDNEFWIRLYKISETDNKPLSGAVFEIYDKDYKLLGTMTTVSNGTATFKVPSAGIYYIKEIVAPEGYIIDSKFEKIVVDDLGSDITIADITRINVKGELYIEIFKHDKETLVGLEGAEFSVFDNNNNLIGTIKTDKNGKGKIKIPKNGTYYLKEITAPNGYELDSSLIPVKVISSFEKETIIKVNIPNKKSKFYIEVLKLDEKTRVPIENVEFNVFDSKSNLIGTITTDALGKTLIEVPETGIYILRETKVPEPYQIDTNPISINVIKSDELVTIIKRVITNIPKEFYIEILKQDEDSKIPLKDAEFEVRDSNNKVIGTLIIDKSGIDKIKVPSAGLYYLIETKAPAGYLLNPSPIDIEIMDDGKIITIIKVNIPNKLKKFYIEVLKQDEETHIPLEGAEFEIRGSNNYLLGTVTTGSDGKAKFEVPFAGLYHLIEIKAPNGFIQNPNPIDINIVDDGKVITIIKVNVPNAKPKLYVEVIKQDEQTHIPLSGAAFELYDKEYNLITSGATKEDGKVKFEVSSEGIYFLKEIIAPKGYIINPNLITVNVVNKDETVTIVKVNVSNKPIENHYIEVIKQDKDTKELLENAEFEVYDSKLNKLGVMITGNDGTAKFEVSSIGLYYLKEIKAPKGYLIYPQMITVNVTSSDKNNIAKITIENVKKNYSIKVIKRDKISLILLPNAEFDVFDSNNSKLGSLKTGEDGTGTLKVPSAGIYYLKETKAPDNYNIHTEPIEVIVNETNEDLTVAEITVENIKIPNKEKEYYIKVIKKDKDNQFLLPNAKFDVFDFEQNKLGELKTDANGTGTFKVPSTGTYYLKETKAPIGYELYTKVSDSNQNIIITEVTIENTKDIKEIEHWIKVYKKDIVNNTPLRDDVFEVFDNNYKSLGIFKTTLPDGSGIFKVPSSGIYYLKEIQSPYGYTLKEGYTAVTVDTSTEIVETTIYNEKTTEKEYWIKIYKKDKVNNAPLGNTIFEVYDNNSVYIGKMVTTLPTGGAEFKVSHEGTYYLKEVQAPYGYILIPDLIPIEVNSTINVIEKTIFNAKSEKEQYIIRVYKKDETNKAPIEDAIIGVYDSSKKLIGEFKTTIPDGSGYFTVNSKGTYYLKEHKAPKNYILKKGFIEVTIDNSSNIVETTIYNKREKANTDIIVINKTDENSNKLQGVKIGIFDLNGKMISSGLTNLKGQLIFEDLEQGSYYVQELSTILGYTIDSKKYDVKITDKGETKEIDIINYKEKEIEKDIAKLVIRKYIDGTTTPISGVEFNIKGSNNIDRTSVTDTMGCIYLDLPIGKYTVKETKSVNGFLADNQEKEIVLQSGNIAQELIFTNKIANGTFTLTKYNSNNSSKLANAEFVLYNADTNLAVKSLITDVNGNISTTIPYGRYIIKEVKAPSGYTLDIQNQQIFEIQKDNPVINLSMTNKQIPVTPVTPQTGNLRNRILITKILELTTLISLLLLIYLYCGKSKLMFNKIANKFKKNKD